MPTPRLFIVRHGETEWSKSGAHTGRTDIPLTPDGERRVRSTARALVGPKRLIVPSNLAAIIVSPRQRARRTLGLLLEEGDAVCADPPSSSAAAAAATAGDDILHGLGPEGRAGLAALRRRGCAVELSERAREWEYGAYEGLKTSEITARRAQQGRGKWVIWSEGAPEGESPEQITQRLDALIADIRARFHAPAFEAQARGEEGAAGDVLVVAHGHILRCLACRWLGQTVTQNPHFIVDAGGVGTLSYEHNNIEEPALVLGGAFIGEGVEKIEGAPGHAS
ncbi:hypothetical protein FH972_021395 [Carpinus fangiana]|uniref:Phosphoglycerate mutase n=1 Tax=Carpinus fangiana TaxID=176857 RepID=A0A5N6KPA1_9ROSI|nr:hypothetical protein FH972_021395 [Carpinus fangiana]